MYTISNKDRDDIIEFITDFREMAMNLPKRGLRFENKKLRAKILLEKLKNKHPSE